MSLMALWLNNDKAPAQSRIEDGLAGNLCRCTGYGPILAALDRAYEIGVRCGRPARRRTGRHRRAAGRAGRPASHRHRRRRARTVRACDCRPARGLAVAHPDATIVAGATDVGLWITKMLQRPACVISLGRIAELDRIEKQGRCRSSSGRWLPSATPAMRSPVSVPRSTNWFAASAASRFAMPARSAATLPTVRRSAISRRC